MRQSDRAFWSGVFEQARLTKRLIENDRDGVGEVEAAYTSLEDRNAIGSIASRGEEFCPKPLGLAAKDQEIAAPVLGFQVSLLTVSREVFEVRRALRLMNHIEGIPVLMNAQIHIRPVVQSRSLEIAVGKRIA